MHGHSNIKNIWVSFKTLNRRMVTNYEMGWVWQKGNEAHVKTTAVIMSLKKTKKKYQKRLLPNRGSNLGSPKYELLRSLLVPPGCSYNKMYETSLSNNVPQTSYDKKGKNCSNYEDDANNDFENTSTNSRARTVYYYSTEQDEHYALIKYNNYLYSTQLIFKFLAKTKLHLTRQIIIIL